MQKKFSKWIHDAECHYGYSIIHADGHEEIVNIKKEITVGAFKNGKIRFETYDPEIGEKETQEFNLEDLQYLKSAIDLVRKYKVIVKSN